MTVSGAAALPDGVTLRSGFTGKEDQTPDFGIGYTDFGARLYSPASRRWMVPDPLSEKYYGISPYAYCNNNPVNFVDPDGSYWLVVGGAVLGAAVNGGIALYQGKSGRELLGTVVVGAISGAVTVASLGTNMPESVVWSIAIDASEGTLYSAVDQLISTGNIDLKTAASDGAFGAVIGSPTGFIHKNISKHTKRAIESVERKYSSEAVQSAIRKEVKSEFKSSGYKPSGNATRNQINATVKDRTELLSAFDKGVEKGVSATVDVTQKQVIGWGIDKLKNWVYEKTE